MSNLSLYSLSYLLSPLSYYFKCTTASLAHCCSVPLFPLSLLPRYLDCSAPLSYCRHALPHFASLSYHAPHCCSIATLPHSHCPTDSLPKCTSVLLPVSLTTSLYNSCIIAYLPTAPPINTPTTPLNYCSIAHLSDFPQCPCTTARLSQHLDSPNDPLSHFITAQLPHRPTSSLSYFLTVPLSHCRTISRPTS